MIQLYACIVIVSKILRHCVHGLVYGSALVTVILQFFHLQMAMGLGLMYHAAPCTLICIPEHACMHACIHVYIVVQIDIIIYGYWRKTGQAAVTAVAI